MLNNFLKILIKKRSIAMLIIAVVFLVPNITIAAVLSVLPNNKTVSVGKTTSLKISVNTLGKSINNSEGTIQFPTDLLEVVSLKKSTSVFSLWVEEPSFSNNTGKINWNGGVVNPGFKGTNGTVFSITFRAKKQGLAPIIFSSGAVRENDGFGTDILTAKNSGVINVGAPLIIIETPIIIIEKSTVPSKPVIISSTHPNQSSWYGNNTVSVSWKIPNGVTSLQTLLNDDPTSTPTITYDNSVTGKTLNNLPEGVSYLHLRYKNSTGNSSIAHYRIKIDTVSPLAFTPIIRIEDNKNKIELNADDVTSEIDYYTVEIDTDVVLKINKDELVNNEYTLPVLNEGNHNLIVVAYDKAGNYTESSLFFASSPISVPIVSLSSSEITNGEFITIFGKTDYPDKQVEVTLAYKGKEIQRYTQTISSDGSFIIITDKLKTTGTISISAETVFSETVRSRSSVKSYLKVKRTKTVEITLSIIYPLLLLIGTIIILMIITFFLYLGWHKYFGLKKSIEIKSKKTAEEVHKAMLSLKKELRNQLKSLEKIKIDRDLNEKEKVIFNEIEKKVDVIDNFIKKELKKFR